MKSLIADMIAAFRFLTRLPLPSSAAGKTDLARAATFFPLAGLAVGAVAAPLHGWLVFHLSRWVAALFTVLLLVLLTGGLHEDGLADVADAFGGASDREQVLHILKDSRIGSFGALALSFSVLARIFLIASLPPQRTFAFLTTAQVLCRWTALPLAAALPAARGPVGQGARLAGQVSPLSLCAGTLLSLALSVWLLRGASWQPWILAMAITGLSGIYYWRRIRGITGDCFGATSQLVEIAVYCCGVWQ